MSEPKRNQYGQYIIADPVTGEERGWPRATTLSSGLEDGFNLARWEERTLVLGLAQRPDLLALAQASVLDDKDLLDRVARDAKLAGGGERAANLGTALHKFAESVDNGEKALSDIPDPYRKTIKGYVKALADAGIVVIDAEVIVLNTQLDIAGTYDRLVRVPGIDLPVILDLKTGKSVRFSHLSHAAQLASYAYADYVFDQETETLKPAPEMDKAVGIIAHLPVGKGACDLYALDLEAGWKAALLARDLYDLRKNKELSRPW